MSTTLSGWTVIKPPFTPGESGISTTVFESDESLSITYFEVTVIPGIPGLFGPSSNVELINNCETGNYSYTDTNPLSPLGVAAVTAPFSALIPWEVQLRIARFSGFDREPTDGNLYVGLMHEPLSPDIRTWDYCVNVSTPARTIRGFPHPANSVLIYEHNTTDVLPPQPLYWRHGIWKSNDQLIRIQSLSGAVRYLIDNELIYTSSRPSVYTQNLYVVVAFDCSGQSVNGARVLFANEVNSGEPVATGGVTGAECEGVFPSRFDAAVPPGASAIVLAGAFMPALPQGPTDPIPVRFQEVTSTWGEFAQEFATGARDVNTLNQRPIRQFQIEWDGLSPEQVGILDAHYERSHSGMTFSIRNVHTGETISGCRYASYSRGDHVRYWSQSRQASIIQNG